MSLFAAYADQECKKDFQEEDQPWLQNSSFQPCHAIPSTSNEIEKEACQNSSDTDDCINNDINVQRKRRKQKHQKEKRKKAKHDTPEEQTQNDSYVIDLKGYRELLSVDTISRPSAPIYRVAFYLNRSSNFRKSKFKRYHKLMLEKQIINEVIFTKQNIQAEICTPSHDDRFTANSSLKEEEELSGRTGHYNRSLAERSDDISMWLEYIAFQDVVHQFEKCQRKGSIAKAQRVLAERKLSIIEKALTLNPSCELLHRERLKIANTAFPTDELLSYLEMLVDKDKSNIILWQGYIEATQCSMSLFNTASVMNLYSRCLSTLHQLRRTSTMDRHSMEESILRMLYQCGLFLKQAGLMEHLWMLLKMYLDVNLAPTGLASMERGKFAVASTVSEKQLAELEEVVFTSQLPLHELWLRTEKLREACHWLPYTEPQNAHSAETEEDCSDPQRLVFAEDVAELIHPITIPENIFKLTAMVLALLKVPLLPCRHTTFEQLGFDHVPSSLDSVEPLLAVYYPLYPVDVAGVGFLLDNMAAPAVGPQYLKTFPGKEAYLEFVLDVMSRCVDCLAGDDRTAVIIWSFRLKRLLAVLAKLGYWKMDDHFKKHHLKKNIKEFLKKEENRQNEVFYLEYALIEHELGNIESCRNIINIALGMNNNQEFSLENWDETQANRCCLFKNLVYLSMQANPEEANDALKHLCEMVLREKVDHVTPSVLKQAESEFDRVSAGVLQTEIKALPPVRHFQPDFFTDWLTCHAWFLYLHKGSTQCQTFLTTVLSKLEERDRSRDASLWYQEVIYELQVAVLLKNYHDRRPAAGMYQVLDHVLGNGLRRFPNNLFLLAALAKEQTLSCSMGPRWWKVQKLLLHSERAFAAVFAVIIATQRMHHATETAMDTITGCKYETDSNMINRILSLFKRITNDGTTTRKCGLIWRLYLQFVYTYSSPNVCRNVYYAAVEECPWLKALYIDAAIYIPAELHQIQDLIIEKQLRLHVTPEELDTLRS